MASAVMNWLPVPSDFRNGLRAALTAPHGVRLEELAALAQYRLGFLETIQLDRALRQVPVEQTADLLPVRLAILASSTTNHLVPAIRVAGLRKGLLVEVHLGAYGQYRQEVLDSTSALHRSRPQMVLFSLSAHEAVAGVPLTAADDDVEAIMGRSIDGLRALWRHVRERLDATVIQQTFLNTADPLFGSFDRLVPGAPARLIACLNDQLAKTAAADSVLLLDLARTSERDGLDTWFDITRWLQAKMEIAPQVGPVYGELVARILAAQRGLSKKCLVLDLDNTLWGGVIGDDGLDGIVLGEGSAAGEAHLALQRYAKQLGQRGVILAICSKNDPEIAEAVFQDHPEMLLKRTDIAAFVANWDDKTINLQRIASQLNIGIDSLVFVDDNPVERARVRQSLPMVAVPELPADPAQYVRCLADAGYFEAVAFTIDDQHRGERYAANVSREGFLQSTESLDDFLRGLNMSVVFGPIQAVDMNRAAQLIGKTNQFNTTTRRHSIQDLAQLVTSNNCLTLQFRLVDRFGDNGLVSVIILRPDAEPGVFEIDTWVMSCRVFGRQLEFEAMNIAVDTARRRGARAFRADYIPTPKNGVVSELYPSLGFARAQEQGLASGTRWVLQLRDYVPRRTYITQAVAA